jgi:hypothetical protein
MVRDLELFERLGDVAQEFFTPNQKNAFSNISSLITLFKANAVSVMNYRLGKMTNIINNRFPTLLEKVDINTCRRNLMWIKDMLFEENDRNIKELIHESYLKNMNINGVDLKTYVPTVNEYLRLVAWCCVTIVNHRVHYTPLKSVTDPCKLDFTILNCSIIFI